MVRASPAGLARVKPWLTRSLWGQAGESYDVSTSWALRRHPDAVFDRVRRGPDRLGADRLSDRHDDLRARADLERLHRALAARYKGGDRHRHERPGGEALGGV